MEPHVPRLRILVIEDLDALRGQIVESLTRPEWRVREGCDGLELDERLREEAADVVVLDVSLPGEDGLEIAQRLRQTYPGIGVVLMSSRGSSNDRANGYGSGADVYISKPFSPNELEAAVFSLARRLQLPERRVFNPELDPLQHRLHLADGRKVDLGATESALLMSLAMAPQRCLSHEELVERLGELRHADISKGHLAVLVSRLRDHCADHPELDRIVLSVRGHGYQLGIALNLRR